MADEPLTDDDILDLLVEYTLPETPPPGYYTAREMYDAALKINPALEYEKYRHRLRLMSERGQLATYTIGRNVYYGIERRV